MSYISQISAFGRSDIEVAGGKGANLGELVRAGLPVPDGFVITTAAYRAFIEENSLLGDIVQLATTAANSEADAFEEAAVGIRALFAAGRIDDELRAEIGTAYEQLGSVAVAVRSSATAEDLADASFAGQQDTYLNVTGLDAVVEAIQSCWASLWTARAMTYRARQGIDPASVSLAVVVQRLADADAAGVMFTANPTNGRRHEVVIGAAWGLGESVVSGSVNTDDLVVNAADGQILSRQTADKAVMTVRIEGGTEERAVPPGRRSAPVLDDAAAAELARVGVRIEAHFGAPQDIEWARVGDEFTILQSRPITALPLPTADTPTDWTVPDPNAFYFRASIVEQLPDPLSPLFADLIDRSVTRSLNALMAELVGHDVLREGDVGMPTLNGYAYYEYTRAGLMEMMRQSPKALVMLAGRKNFSAQARWRDYSRPRYQEAVDKWTSRPLDELADGELMAGIVELLDAGTEYYTAVQTIIPIAASSEVIFTRFYAALVRRPTDPPAATFLLGSDSLPILAEKSLYDLASWVREHPALAGAILTSPVDKVVERLRTMGSEDASWSEFGTRFQAHLDRYGHTVYNLDFINAVPADDPAPLIDTLQFYLRGEGSNPYVRQGGSMRRREEAAAAILDRLDPVRARIFSRLLNWAQSIAPERENALADVGLAWPQMRRMLAELGRRLVAAGAIATADEVFWLRRAELAALSDPGSDGVAPPDVAATIAERQEVWRGERRASPPVFLPRGTWLEWFDSMMPATSADQSGDVLTGIGASAGRVTATARVLEGPQDFSQLQSGDILVAGITTPAWTSLFARASGVVTDVGGPLSHSSIVAREYGIPAVLGTGVGTRRIRSGQRITVDGDLGTVTLLDGAGDTAPVAPSAPAAVQGRPRTAVVVGVVAAGAAALVLLGWLVRRRRATG